MTKRTLPSVIQELKDCDHEALKFASFDLEGRTIKDRLMGAYQRAHQANYNTLSPVLLAVISTHISTLKQVYGTGKDGLQMVADFEENVLTLLENSRAKVISP